MAYCKKGVGECTACGACEEKPVMLDDYDGTPIYPGEDYYDIDGTIIAEDNLKDWAWEYIKNAD